MTIRGRLLVLLALVTAGAAIAVGVVSRNRASLAFHLLDVGQGDAILLRSGNADILVDGGPDASVLEALAAVRPVWDPRLEVVVLTHPDLDHLGGLLPVLERDKIGLVLLPELPMVSAHARSFIRLLVSRRIPVRFARAGQKISTGDLVMEVLAPDEATRELARKRINDGSVVLRASLGITGEDQGFSVLLTGDIGRGAEAHLVRRFGGGLDADVVKVPHHGSRTSSSRQFLAVVRPAIAVVSVGEGNRFGHPVAAVLARYAPALVLRTDQSGTISLRVDRSRTFLACARGCPEGKPATK